MLDNIGDINPNVLFAKEGLIKVDEKGNVLSWDVWCQRMGGAGYIKLNDNSNIDIRNKVEKILEEIQMDKNYKIMDVMTGLNAKVSRNGMYNADYVIISEPGYEVRENPIGTYIINSPTQMAQHGYVEELYDMKAVLFLKGREIPVNKDLGEFDLIDIAPTLANIMGFEMNDVDGINRIK
ncbi:MAG: hypothetical protein GXZ08_07780 [Tissierellia bacterium]|nr:hypothetical protein [Tissierellia bacterium]